MYPALARGYATEFVSKKINHQLIDDWYEGPKAMKALDAFGASCFAKKPGRVLKRLMPTLRPVFRNPIIAAWTKPKKIIMAEALSAAPEAEVFAVAAAEVPLFQERSIFLSNVFLSADKDDARVDLMTVANISHHAIARLLEREQTSPELLEDEILIILMIVRSMALVYENTSLDKTISHTFLLPYEGGALPVATMHVRTGKQSKDASKPVMSVRTFLSSEMLTSDHYERMGGFDVAKESFTDRAGSLPLVRWMEVNARPRTPISQPADEALPSQSQPHAQANRTLGG